MTNPASGLGPTTERRFAEAFATSALVTRRVAAALIGVDVKTLDGMRDEGLIRAVRRGKVPAYTERDLRAYLVEPAVVRPSPPSHVGSGPQVSRTWVAGFSDRPARLRIKRPMR